MIELGVFGNIPLVTVGAEVFPLLVFVCSFIGASGLVTGDVVGGVAGEGSTQG